ncbi:hypothetical protein GF322_00635 [Candidatus Dependentiae bacterium]|nr:hypothetical protein [Candidatus Dependentiae bacterium]
MLKKTAIIFTLCFLSGCRIFYTKDVEVINMQDYKQIVNGNFDNLYDVIKIFPKSSQDVKKRTQLAIDMVKGQLNEIFAIKPESRTFKNTALAFDELEEKFGIISNGIEILEMVSPKKDIRDACHDSAIQLRAFAIDAFMNRKIYQAFKEYIAGENIKKEKLNPVEKYFLSETMNDFKRQGFDLPEEDFEKVKEIKKEISRLGLEFDKNMNIDKSFIKVEEKDLAGLEQDFIENLKQDSDGRYILTCDYPIYFEVMQHCSVPHTRENLYLAFNNRAYPENIALLNLIIEKRDKLAKKLGYDSFSHLNLDNQMVKSPDRAQKFLSDLGKKTMKKADKEFVKFTEDLPNGIQLDKDGKINSWDFAYLKECYKKKNFNIDERAIAQYFPVQNTLEKIFEIYQKFLNLKFKFVENVEGLWHEDVKVVEVYDHEDEKRGFLFLDLYPRDNKYSHACMASIVETIKRKKNEGFKKIPAVIVLIANFPKATKDKPALLKHNDVETFFHEFGHAMHGLLGRTELASFSGTNVKRDFVEMPSQMFEEWLWDRNILRFISSHYKTDQNLPDDVIDRKIELKKFDSGFFVTRQVWLSFIALDCFLSGAYKDTDKLIKNLHQKYIKNIRFDPRTHFQAAFGHLIGYGARYYGYMWSKVFALDLFEKVKKKGLLNSEIGQEFANKILSKGGSVEPDKLLRNFLGRAPNQEAFLKEYGID